MATETRSVRTVQNPFARLQHGVAGGLLAGVVMGALVQVVMGQMTAIGALYTLGEPSLTVGWVAHLFHSALFGALFGVAAGPTRVSRLVSGYPAGVVSGAAFASALWAVNIVIVWPLWQNSVGLGVAAPPVPNLSVQPLVGHVVYGAILGLVVVALSSKSSGSA